MCGGSLVNFTDNAKTFVEPGPDRIGRKYVKALYVEYTDATFKQKKVRGVHALCAVCLFCVHLLVCSPSVSTRQRCLVLRQLVVLILLCHACGPVQPLLASPLHLINAPAVFNP
jgi:hypothetical protein